MSRYTMLSAAAVLIVFAAHPAAADSCMFEKSEPVSSSVGNAGGVFEIDDFSFDIEQTLNIGSQSSGAGAGKVTFNQFQITKTVDSATPKLFQSAVTGEGFRDVKCSFYILGPNGAKTIPYLTATFSNAIITKFKVEGSADGTPRVKFWLQYEKVEWQY
jgi:type VI secretion system Hcp family effector